MVRPSINISKLQCAGHALPQSVDMIKQRIQRVCCGLKSTGFCCRTVGVPKYIYIAIQAYVSLDGMSLYEYQKPETPAYVSLGGMSLYEHETPACEMLENSRGSASGFS